jgi:hypothetical protein
LSTTFVFYQKVEKLFQKVEKNNQKALKDRKNDEFCRFLVFAGFFFAIFFSKKVTQKAFKNASGFVPQERFYQIINCLDYFKEFACKQSL